MNKVKILAIVGSLRKGSYKPAVGFAAKEIVKDTADFTLLDYQDVPLMNEDN